MRSAERKLRVIIVSDISPFGGAERYIELHASCINRDKYELIIVCPPDCQWIKKISPYINDIILLPLPTPYDYKPKVLQLHLLSLHRRNIIAYAYNKVNPDLIHINQAGLSNGIIAVAAALRTGIPVISTVHSSHLPSQTMMRSGRLRDPAVYFTTWLWRNPKIFVSRSSKNLFEKNFPWSANKNFVVHNGLDCSLYSLPDERQKKAAKRRILGRDDQRVIGFLGRIEIEKGIETLLQAFQSLALSYPDLRLLIYGEGSFSKDLWDWVSGNALEDRVVMGGWAENIDEVLNSVDIFCLPTRREGFPYSTLEAMAKGLPVVASAVDGIPEQVVDGLTGCLVPPGNPGELARAIGTLLADPGLAARMGLAGRRRVEADFSLVDSVARTCGIYERISKQYKHR